MDCKYKGFSEPRACQVTGGECQFLLCQYGPECPVYQAFADWDRFWAEADAAAHGGTAYIKRIMAADVYDGEAAHPECVTLDLDFD